MPPHRPTIAIMALICFLAVVACDSFLQPAEDLPVTRITPSGFAGFDTPQRGVVHTQAEWEDLWQTLWRNKTEVPPLPAIDFSTEMVVVAAAGTKPSTGFDITVESATANSRLATVTVRSTSPGPGCFAAAVLTSPIDVVRLPRRDEVTFIEKTETRRC